MLFAEPSPLHLINQALSRLPHDPSLNVGGVQSIWNGELRKNVKVNVIHAFGKTNVKAVCAFSQRFGQHNPC